MSTVVVGRAVGAGRQGGQPRAPCRRSSLRTSASTRASPGPASPFLPAKRPPAPPPPPIPPPLSRPLLAPAGPLGGAGAGRGLGGGLVRRHPVDCTARGLHLEELLAVALQAIELLVAELVASRRRSGPRCPTTRAGAGRGAGRAGGRSPRRELLDQVRRHLDAVVAHVAVEELRDLRACTPAGCRAPTCRRRSDRNLRVRGLAVERRRPMTWTVAVSPGLVLGLVGARPPPRGRPPRAARRSASPAGGRACPRRSWPRRRSSGRRPS